MHKYMCVCVCVYEAQSRPKLEGRDVGMGKERGGKIFVGAGSRPLFLKDPFPTTFYVKNEELTRALPISEMEGTRE